MENMTDYPTQTVLAAESIVIDGLRPDKYCATGYNGTRKCPRFIPRVIHWPLAGEHERPFCDKYMRDLKPDGQAMLRHSMCVRDFGSPGCPGRCQHIKEPERDIEAEINAEAPKALGQSWTATQERQLVGKTTASIRALPFAQSTDPNRATKAQQLLGTIPALRARGGQ
jgi:hypothetical protein